MEATNIKKLTEMAARLRDASESVGGWPIMEEAATMFESVVQAREDALEEAAKRLEEFAEAWGGDIPFAREKQVTYQAAAESVRALKHTGRTGE